MTEDRIRKWWLISVSGYGEFAYFGTENEAEEMRSHKSSWEGGIAHKKQISQDHPMVTNERDFMKWQNKNGYPLEERELEAIASKEISH